MAREYVGGYCDANLLGELGDAHLSLRQHYVDVYNNCSNIGIVAPLDKRNSVALEWNYV